MKRLLSLSLFSVLAAFAFGACAVGPDETDDVEDTADEAGDEGDVDAVEEPGDTTPAFVIKRPKCAPDERWCRCGGCTPIELKCNPYCD